MSPENYWREPRTRPTLPSHQVKALLVRLAVTLLVVGVGLLLYFRFTGSISSAQARQLVSEGALLVDVRSPEEFSAGHIEGALNIPVGELAQRLTELGDKHEPIVLYCRSGARSGRALSLLQRQGFTAVSNLGAMSRW
jgi:phage shock protein E